MKKLIVYLSLVVFWLVGVILFLNTGKSVEEEEHDFTVLAVKDDAVKDYNSMPVFQKLAKETGKDVYYIYNPELYIASIPLIPPGSGLLLYCIELL